MKSAPFFLTFMIGLCAVALAQPGKLNSADSIRIELERGALAKNLIDLRDSMAVSLVAFGEKIKTAKPSEIVKLADAHKELSAYQEQLELDIEEISQTSLNAWTDYSKDRIQLATINARRHYKRIITLL